MNKHLKLPLNIELVHHSAQTVLRLSFHREALCDWCLGLCLLKEGLIETLTVTEQRTKVSKIEFLTKTEIGGPLRVSFKPNASRVEMARSDLDYLQHFFLKYYRDGVAEVDHLDLQAIDAETGDKEIYVTFKVPDSISPVSSEEVRRRLGS